MGSYAIWLVKVRDKYWRICGTMRLQMNWISALFNMILFIILKSKNTIFIALPGLILPELIIHSFLQQKFAQTFCHHFPQLSLFLPTPRLTQTTPIHRHRFVLATLATSPCGTMPMPPFITAIFSLAAHCRAGHLLAVRDGH